MSVVRLVMYGGNKIPGAEKALAPTVRLGLVLRDRDAEKRKMKTANATKTPAPQIRLAHIHGAQGTCTLTGAKGVEKLPPDQAPALLVSFYYLKPFLSSMSRYEFRDWAMDSGAFSAHNSGGKIELEEYIATCIELRKTQPKLSEIFALDVIGDHRATLRNTECMWKAGIEAIPCYHLGEPVDALKHMAKNYPKIALGGVARQRGAVKMQFAAACFKLVWPKPIHGFGYGSEEGVMGFPWHSTDATNWELGPCGFGRWMSFGKMSVRGSSQNLRSEVEWYLRLEERARSRWSKEMKLLEAAQPAPMTVYLGRSGKPRMGGDARTILALGGKEGKPVVRLAMANAAKGLPRAVHKAIGRKLL